MNIGNRIKARREELGMSQGDLAKKMGVSRQAISKAESHDGNITTDKAERFAKALDISVAFLLYGDTEHIVLPKSREEYLDLSDDMRERVDKYDMTIEVIEKFEKLPDDRKRLVLRLLDTWGIK